MPLPDPSVRASPSPPVSAPPPAWTNSTATSIASSAMANRREGQIWEAADFIVDHALTNVVPIFNCNELAQSRLGFAPAMLPGPGRQTRSIRLHRPHHRWPRPRANQQALNEMHVIQNGHRPLAIVARTVKGWGPPHEQGMGKHGTPVKKDAASRVPCRTRCTPPKTLASRITNSTAK